MGNHASDGHQFMEIDATNTQVDDVYQDIQTVAGQSYTLSLDIAARADTPLSTNTIDVYWNNALVQSIDPASTNWETHRFTVVGTGGLDRLEFREQAGDNDSYGGLIDNVSLVATDRSNDTLHGGDGNDTIYGGLGSDTLYGNDGSDLFMFAKGDGSDTIYGGAGSGWTDVIRMSGVHQGYTPDAPGSDWTLHLTHGSVASTDANGVTLSQDAAGEIHFDDGNTVVFQDIERIEWH
jgi:Ca2+-binding RTX toxin-like protein